MFYSVRASELDQTKQKHGSLGYNLGDEFQRLNDNQKKSVNIEVLDEIENAKPADEEETIPIEVDRKYCIVCNLEQPLRTKHCRVCQKCVATYDHHCPWVGNCIGEK